MFPSKIKLLNPNRNIFWETYVEKLHKYFWNPYLKTESANLLIYFSVNAFHKKYIYLYIIFLCNVSSNNVCIAIGKTVNAENQKPWYRHREIGLLSSTIMWHSNFITLFWHWTIIRDGCLLLLAWFMLLWDYKCILSWNRAEPRGNKALCFMTHQLASCANQKKNKYWVCTRLLSPYLSLPLSSDN